MFSRMAFAAALLCAAPALAQSPGWDGAFPAEALERVLPRKLQKVLVVRATPDDDATAASVALIDGLKAAGAQVLDDSSLGDVSALGDAALAQKAKAMGADSAAIVRIYPGPSGQPMAAVSVVDASGAPLVSFSLEKGQVLGGQGAPAQAENPPAQNENPPAQGENPPVEPAQPPNPAPAQPPPPPPGQPPYPAYGQYPAPPAPPQLTPAQGQYQAQFLGFGTYSRWTPYGPVNYAGAYQGVGHVPISVGSFFEQVGRKDLAGRYRSRQATRSGLMIGGTVITLGSLIAAGAVAASAPSVDECNFAFDSQGCFDTRDARGATALAVGLGGAVVGLVMAGVGYGLNPMPVSAAEAQKLADGYNANLRNKLGLGAQGALAPEARPLKLSFAPMLAPHTGGLAMRLEF